MMSGEDCIRFSIVIPAFDEEARLPATMQILSDFLVGKEAEVILVIEKSPDATLRLATEFARQHPQFRVLDTKQQRGKGFAVKQGMLAARGSVIFFMDTDLSVPIRTVDTFLTFLEARPEVDVLIGNRQHAGSDIAVAQGWLRRSMGQVFNRIIRLILHVSVRDTQCGFKAFRQAAARKLFTRQQVDGFAFDVEILMRAEKMGLHLADLPVEWSNSRISKVHVVADSFQMLLDILRIRWLTRK